MSPATAALFIWALSLLTSLCSTTAKQLSASSLLPKDWSVSTPHVQSEMPASLLLFPPLEVNRNIKPRHLREVQRITDYVKTMINHTHKKNWLQRKEKWWKQEICPEFRRDSDFPRLASTAQPHVYGVGGDLRLLARGRGLFTPHNNSADGVLVFLGQLPKPLSPESHAKRAK